MTKQKKLLLNYLLKQYKQNLNQGSRQIFGKFNISGKCQIHTFIKVNFPDTVIVNTLSGAKLGDRDNAYQTISKRLLDKVYTQLLNKYKNLYKISARHSGDGGIVELQGAGQNIQEIKDFIEKRFSKTFSI